MIVYGKSEDIESAADVVGSVAFALRSACRRPAGIGRHSALVSTFIRASALVQGIADAEFAEAGLDRRSAAQDVGALLLLRFAEGIGRSWYSGFRTAPDPAPILHLLGHLRYEGPIRIRSCEGYAHYALYPESYLEAARRSGLAPKTCVIGIRSIGLGLAAMIAAALGAAPAISVRPVGDPFRRTIQADRRLIAGAVAEGTAPFAVVDEGPGLSGSSFAAVAEWLIESGVAQDRIHFFPSHGGAPGHAASPSVRDLWAGIARHDARQDDILLSRDGLAAWLHDLIGAPTGPPREIATWPKGPGGTPIPRDARFERRKFLFPTRDGLWLAKFAGLGDVGLRKLRDASLLAQAGFSPRVAGSRHGFLVQEWIAEPSAPSPDRADLLRRLVQYLAFRAKHFPATRPGASLEELRDMAEVNTAERLGPAAAEALGSLLAGTASMRDSVHPIRTDNRLHDWEWIARGREVLKLDAVDHCESHDLIGCQDPAWDIAGASVEHGLSASEREDLFAAIAAAGAPRPDARLVAWMTPCYLAFQLGLWSTATAPQGSDDARERVARGYAHALMRLLACAPEAGLPI